MNAKDELLEDLLNKPKVKCAKILTGNEWDEDEEKRQIPLKVNHTEEDWHTFLNNLNFTYDNGFGSQELFGILWFEDGSWLERYEYDGSEYWTHKTCPKIPAEII